MAGEPPASLGSNMSGLAAVHLGNGNIGVRVTVQSFSRCSSVW